MVLMDDTECSASLVITSPPVGEAKYCDDHVCLSLCLSVYLSVREHISETTRPIFTEILCMLPTCMSVARSSSGGVVIRYILLVLWMTSYLHILGHMQGCQCNTGTANQPTQ